MESISFRPVCEADHTFLERLYGTTRESELSQTGWSSAEKEAFIKMQFDAQHRHYQQHFAEARFDVIERDGKPIGRLYVDRRSDEIRIIDIALLPEERGHGLGGHLMKGLLSEARGLNIPVRIHVEQFNPALRLYERLGFGKIQDEGVYYLMEWRPNTQEKPAS
jgi:GNAT superfamily N-acetyltransferase